MQIRVVFTTFLTSLDEFINVNAANVNTITISIHTTVIKLVLYLKTGAVFVHIHYTYLELSIRHDLIAFHIHLPGRKDCSKRNETKIFMKSVAIDGTSNGAKKKPLTKRDTHILEVQGR